MKEHYPVRETEGYKPEEFWGSDCHCPEPEVSEDGKKCVRCNGDNPVVAVKKSRRRKK